MSEYFLTIFIGLSLISGLLFSGLFYAIWKFRDQRKSWLVWTNADAGRIEIERRRIAKDIISKKRDKRIYFLNGKARQSSDRGGVWVIDESTGANLVPPTYTATQRLAAQTAYKEALQDAQSRNEPNPGKYAAQIMGTIIQVFAICNPGFAWNKLRTNSYEKWRRTQEGKEDWRVKIALPAMILGIFAIAALAYIMIRMNG